MAGVNKVIIVGRLGRDPEIRHTADGTAIANFSVATSQEWKDKASGEKKEKTEWHRVVAFRKLAEICGQFLKKGRQVYVEGHLQTRQYEKDGQTHYATEIVANEVQFLGGREEGASVPADPGQMPGYQPPTGPPVGTDDDIPF